MKVAIASCTTKAAEVIHQLLSPWNISFTSLDDAEIVVVYKEKPLETKKTVVIPSDSPCFMKWAKDVKLRFLRKIGERICVTASEQTVLTIAPQMLYHFDGIVESTVGDDASTETRLGENLVILTLDVLKEYNTIVDETLNAERSNIYRLLTSLPVPYGVAPRRLRDFFMSESAVSRDLGFCDKLPLDALRFILVRALEKLSKEKIQKKTWNGKRYACAITHDVETQRGLQRARYLKKLEEKYDVPSAWYIPSKRYKLNSEIIKELADYGEIGAHDTWHDGRLAQLAEQKLIERLLEAKRALGKIISRSIEGFRAPLLQHNIRIIQALERAGYTYDTSIPTWEPKHPYTMKPHGIATTYSLTLNGLTEIPVTLPQDHQLLHVLGLTPREVIRKWLDMAYVIKDLGGLCTFLIHPDYKLANPGLHVYEELIDTITSDDQALITVPSEIAFTNGL